MLRTCCLAGLLLITLECSNFAQSTAAAAPGSLTLDPVKAGDSPKITGRTLVTSGQVSISINGHVVATGAVGADGTFSIGLRQRLAAGDRVEVAQLSDGQALVSAALDVQPAEKRAKAGERGGADPPASLQFYMPSALEPDIQQLQDAIRRYRERDNSGAIAKKPAKTTRGSDGSQTSQFQTGCVDDTFQSKLTTLSADLTKRLDGLKDALAKALAAGPQNQKNDATRANYDRMVRALRAAIDLTQKQLGRVPDGICPLKVTPFNLVTIYEETEKERIQQYNPVMADQRLTSFSIDKASKLRVDINAAALSPDAVFGGVRISGNLTNGGKTAKVEVANYSQVSVDPKSQKSQQAVNLQAASDIKAAFSDLWSLMLEFVRTIYGEDPRDWVTGDPTGTWWGTQSPDVSKMSKDRIDEIRNDYRQYKNEIESIDDALTSNPVLLQLVASDIFGMPQATLQSFLKDFKTNLEIMLSGDYQPQAQTKAMLSVVQTTQDVWSALMHTQDFIDGQKLIAPNQPDSDAENTVFEEFYQQVIDQLRKQIQPGEIDLPSYQPQDGATLALQVEIVGNGDSASSQGSSSSVALFTVKIKDYRVRPELVDSTFYLRRMKDVRAQNGSLARVNFAPAPGATYGLMFHSRGPTGLEDRCMDRTGVLWLRSGSACADNFQPVVIAHQTKANRFFSALAPGIGANINLLNFTNPAPQVPTGGYGTPDTAPTVQIGTGFVGSLFGGAIQFTYGWDLNIEKSRSYWGIGFSFVKIGQAAVQKLSGGSSSSSAGN